MLFILICHNGSLSIALCNSMPFPACMHVCVQEHKVETERRLKAEQDRKAERERLDREARTREEEHTRRELDEIKRLKAQERLEALKKTSVGARALGGISSQDLEQMDVDEIFSKQLKQLEKEKREKDTKLKTQEKKVCKLCIKSTECML